MTTISAKFSPMETAYLEKIARENHLFRGETTEPSTGKAMKELVKWCRLSGIKIGARKDNDTDESLKMLEQIHATIPQMMYHLRLQILLNSDNITDELAVRSKESAVGFLNASCGQFQEVSYKTISPSADDNGLNRLPTERGVSGWVSRKV